MEIKEERHFMMSLEDEILKPVTDENGNMILFNTAEEHEAYAREHLFPKGLGVQIFSTENFVTMEYPPSSYRGATVLKPKNEAMNEAPLRIADDEME